MPNRGPRPQPKEIRGVKYPTVRVAAKALKVSRAAIYYAEKAGNIHTVGTRSLDHKTRTRAQIELRKWEKQNGTS